MLRASLLYLARQKNVSRMLERAVMAEAVAAGRNYVKFLEPAETSLPTASNTTATTGSLAAPTRCVSLDHFFEEIRRQRRLVGHTSARESRNEARDHLRTFWSDHIRSAVSMSKNARDLGFIAFYGLADSQLALPSECMTIFVSLLTRDEMTCAAMDAVSILHFLGREVNRSRAEALHPETVVPSELIVLFVALGFRLIARLFASVDRHVGKAEDATHALEFIVYVGMTAPDVSETATKLLRIASLEDMRMTSLISAFALLRVFDKLIDPRDSALIALDLTRRLREKDTRLVNPFHCLKVVNTLTRIPPPGLLQPNLWRYIVSKVAIFAPMTTVDHQDLMVTSVVRSLLARGLLDLAEELLTEVEELAVPEARLLVKQATRTTPS